MASSSPLANWTHHLTELSKSDIGNFIGKNGALLRKFVYSPVIKEYKESCNAPDDAKVPMKIKIYQEPSDESVYAEITTPTDQTDLNEIHRVRLLVKNGSFEVTHKGPAVQGYFRHFVKFTAIAICFDAELWLDIVLNEII